MKIQGRIMGPAMFEAVSEVYRIGPFSSMLALGEHYRPGHGRNFQYNPIHRAIDAGWLDIDPKHPEASPYGMGAVVITKAGERAVEEYMDRLWG